MIKFKILGSPLPSYWTPLKPCFWGFIVIKITASDAIPYNAVKEIGLDITVKFGDCCSNCLRANQPGHFFANDNKLNDITALSQALVYKVLQTI